MEQPPATPGSAGPTRAALVLGVGLGGFFDGIVFHQVLQWHHVLSNQVPPTTVAQLELNTLADGLFHSGTWVVTVVGVWLLARSRGVWARASARGADRGEPNGAGPPGRRLAGGVVAGWGGFNLVEGIVDHYVLQLHHVRAGPDAALYDAAFLVWGALFVALGWWLAREPAIRRAQPSPRTSRT